jgi:hypothetical protein
MKNNHICSLLFSLLMISSHGNLHAEIIRVTKNSALELTSNRGVKFQIDSKTLRADVLGLYSVSEADVENYHISPLADGYKVTGKMVLPKKGAAPKKDLLTFETTYKKAEGEAVLIHSEIQYLSSQKCHAHYRFTFPLNGKDETGILRDIRAGSSCEVYPGSTSLKKTYDLMKQEVTTAEDIKKVIIRKTGALATVEPGAGSTMNILDTRSNNTDNWHIFVMVLSHKIADPAHAGEKDVIEVILHLEKNEPKDAVQP